MSTAFLFIVILQLIMFHEPPQQAPVFRYWSNPGVWSNPADEPASMSVPADIDLRDYLNERGVCVENESTCSARIRYRVTLDARDPESATRAVIQYVIVGPSDATHEGCAWLNMDRTERQDYIRTGDTWTQERLHPSTVPEHKMVNLILAQAVRHLSR